jgi:hypothetical protein
LAHLAIRLSGGQGLLQVVDLKPILLAHGHRVHGLSLPEAAVGVGPLGAFGGYVLMPVSYVILTLLLYLLFAWG